MICNCNNPVVSLVGVELVRWKASFFEIAPRGYAALTFRVKGTAKIKVDNKTYSVQANEVLYMGDDTVDLPVMRQAGIAATVADAPIYMDEGADYRTRLPGGQGAVREVIDMLLMQSGKWSAVMARYGLEDYKF